MYAGQLSITDRFVELGNLFFNVKDTGREYKFDLYYENTSQDPVNRFMVENEDRIEDFYKFINSIIEFVVGIFVKPKNTSNEILEKHSSQSNYKMRNRNNNALKNLSSQQVIRKNVRNRLLQSISINKQNENTNTSIKEKFSNFLHKFTINSISKGNKKVVVKNRFMGDKS